MLNQKTIAVIVPAYNEEKQIESVIESIPEFVDRIIVVNDGSTDTTASVVLQCMEGDAKEKKEIQNELNRELAASLYGRAELAIRQSNKEEAKLFSPSAIANKNTETDRIILINHLVNSGVGAAVATGYKWCKDYGIDVIAKIDGDGQMDPSELESICKPVAEGQVDYVKGNRLIHRSAWLVIPKIRYFGNSILSILTKIASGYWHVSDTQTAFTAISKKALNGIRLYNIHSSYGYPNDLLVKLNISMCTIKEVEVKPVYNVGEKSKMRILLVIPRISLLLLKSFFKRLWIKYLFRDFHPLFLLYNFSMILFIVWLPYLYKVAAALWAGITMSFETLFAFTFLGISAFQSLLFAMWMDIQDNERLYK